MSSTQPRTSRPHKRFREPPPTARQPIARGIHTHPHGPLPVEALLVSPLRGWMGLSLWSIGSWSIGHRGTARLATPTTSPACSGTRLQDVRGVRSASSSSPDERLPPSVATRCSPRNSSLAGPWHAYPGRGQRAVGELILSGRSTAPDSSATAFGRHDRVRLALAGPNVSPAAAQLVITSTEPGLMMPIRARTVVGEGTANCRRCGPEPKASDGPSSSHSGLFCA